ESGGQLYLLFSKWTHLIPGEREDADRRSLAQHRNAENSTISVESLCKSVFGIGLDVGNMNHLSFEQDPSVNRTAFRVNRNASGVIHEFGGESVGSVTIEQLTFLSGNGGFVGIAKASSGFNEGLQHRRQIKCRPADDLEHVGRGCLLLQRLAQLVEQPRVLDGNYGLG